MMNYSDIPKFLQGYVLEIAVYILNSIPNKSIPNTLVELWTGRKANVQHYKIWKCPSYVFKGKIEKLDPNSEVCYFVEYPKETKDWLFYDPEVQIVLISTSTIFSKGRLYDRPKP